jgi:hypothetical protein
VSLIACASNPSDPTGTSSGEGGTSTGTGSEAGTPTTGGPDTGDTSSTGAPPAAGLRLHQLQAMGTHNSYHVSSGSSVKDLDYTHKPLPEQLDAGARQFELDLNFTTPGAPIEVYHLGLVDQMSNCPLLKDCLQALRGWSEGRPGHHILYVMLELKTAYNAVLWDELLADLEAELLAVWPREDIVAPDDVQGDAATVREGLAANGWPTIDASRGKILFVLHDGGNWRDSYVAAGTGGRLLFPDAFGDLAAPFAAVHTINDPIGDAAAIAAAVDAGHLVRTRADADLVEPLAGDDSRAMAALASGATFISTDYPPPMGEVDYVFEIPGGTPSRCNPRAAPADCTPADIEAP